MFHPFLIYAVDGILVQKKPRAIILISASKKNKKVNTKSIISNTFE